MLIKQYYGVVQYKDTVKQTKFYDHLFQAKQHALQIASKLHKDATIEILTREKEVKLGSPVVGVYPR